MLSIYTLTLYFSITKNNILNIQNNKPMAITYFQIKPGNK
jgi:hypothetical protein